MKNTRDFEATLAEYGDPGSELINYRTSFTFLGFIPHDTNELSEYATEIRSQYGNKKAREHIYGLQMNYFEVLVSRCSIQSKRHSHVG